MIRVKKISKHYKLIKAVDDLSFEANRGEVLGILGPNGAGKSTTMKIITCFIHPTIGSVEVDGLDILKQPIEVKKKIGYMPENAPLYEEMVVFDFLSFVAEIREIPKNERLSKIKKVMDLTHIKEVHDRKIETLSKGYKRRVSMAQALIHDPEILILDEPTDGLDPNQKHDVRKLIKKLAKDKCILISTHILEEVEAVCQKVVIIANGSLKYSGTPEELKSKSTFGRIDDVFRAMTLGEEVEGVSL